MTAAAAFLWAEHDDVIAELVTFACATDEFLDRWRLPGEPASHVWEERFGEQVYVPLADQAINDALKAAGVTADELDHVVVTGVHARAARSVAKRIGARPEACAPDLGAVIGNAGTAQLGIALAEVLDRAEPGQLVMLVQLADGASVVVLRTTEAIAGYREPAAITVAAQIESGRDDLPYPTFLTWRGFLDREPPRRPDPEAYYGPPAHRTEAWKFAFVGSRCTECGVRPPSAGARLQQLQRGRPDGAGAAVRHAGDDRDLHRSTGWRTRCRRRRLPPSSTSTAVAGTRAS